MVIAARAATVAIAVRVAAVAAIAVPGAIVVRAVKAVAMTMVLHQSSRRLS